MLNPSGLSDILLFSTVKITVQKSNIMSSGTGFFFEVLISPNRNILVLITNKHVIEYGVAGDFYIYRANLDGTPNGEFETFLIRNFEDVQFTILHQKLIYVPILSILLIFLTVRRALHCGEFPL